MTENRSLTKEISAMTRPQIALDVIHCGDFLTKSTLLGHEKFDVVIADPPYNIGKDFGNDTDRQDFDDYLQWADRWLSICLRHLSDNGVIYVYGFAEILAHIAVKFPINRQRWLVWHYTNKAVPRLKLRSMYCLV